MQSLTGERIRWFFSVVLSVIMWPVTAVVRLITRITEGEKGLEKLDQEADKKRADHEERLKGENDAKNMQEQMRDLREILDYDSPSIDKISVAYKQINKKYPFEVTLRLKGDQKLTLHLNKDGELAERQIHPEFKRAVAELNTLIRGISFFNESTLANEYSEKDIPPEEPDMYAGYEDEEMQRDDVNVPNGYESPQKSQNLIDAGEPQQGMLPLYGKLNKLPPDDLEGILKAAKQPDPFSGKDITRAVMSAFKKVEAPARSADAVVFNNIAVVKGYVDLDGEKARQFRVINIDTMKEQSFTLSGKEATVDGKFDHKLYSQLMDQRLKAVLDDPSFAIQSDKEARTENTSADSGRETEVNDTVNETVDAHETSTEPVTKEAATEYLQLENGMTLVNIPDILGKADMMELLSKGRSDKEYDNDQVHETFASVFAESGNCALVANNVAIIKEVQGESKNRFYVVNLDNEQTSSFVIKNKNMPDVNGNSSDDRWHIRLNEAYTEAITPELDKVQEKLFSDPDKIEFETHTNDGSPTSAWIHKEHLGILHIGAPFDRFTSEEVHEIRDVLLQERADRLRNNVEGWSEPDYQRDKDHIGDSLKYIVTALQENPAQTIVFGETVFSAQPERAESVRVLNDKEELQSIDFSAERPISEVMKDVVCAVTNEYKFENIDFAYRYDNEGKESCAVVSRKEDGSVLYSEGRLQNGVIEITTELDTQTPSAFVNNSKMISAAFPTHNEQIAFNEVPKALVNAIKQDDRELNICQNLAVRNLGDGTIAVANLANGHVVTERTGDYKNLRAALLHAIDDVKYNCNSMQPLSPDRDDGEKENNTFDRDDEER